MEKFLQAITLDVIQGIISAGGLTGAWYLLYEERQRRLDLMKHTYRLHHPPTMSHEQVLAFLRSLSGLPKQRALGPAYSISLEYYVNWEGEQWFLRMAPGISTNLDALYYDHIDEVLEPVKDEDDPILNTNWTAIELCMQKGVLGGLVDVLLMRPPSSSADRLLQPYKILDHQATAKNLRSHMRQFVQGESACVQWIITPAHPGAAVGAPKEKAADHLFNAVVRLAATGDDAWGTIANLSSTFQHVESEHVIFRKRTFVGDVGERVRLRASTKGFTLMPTAKELSCLIGWPLSGGGAKRSRRLAPSIAHDVPGPGMITLGASNFPNMHNRQVAMPISAADQHISITGGTGAGKSVLLTNLVLGAIADPELACIILEPAGDLSWDILRRIPEHRVKDVIFFDPGDVEYPIGMNPFQGTDPERMASHLIGIMKFESGDSWSPTIQRVMSAAVLATALLDLTLYDTRQLLVDREFRNTQLRKLPRKKFPQLRQEFDWIDSRPDAVVDSSVSRLEALQSTRLMKNIVSQKKGLDFNWIIREHKILICPLAAPKIGETNAAALGQMIRELAQTAAMAQPMNDRRDSMVVMDEYRHYADKSRTRSEPFSELRKFKQKLVVASQYLGQLPREIQETIENNVATHIAFRQSPENAKAIVKRFGPLNEDDLSNLPRYTAAARINSTDGIAPTVTLRTPPPAPMTPHWSFIIDRTRKLYAKPRAEVEAEILTRHTAPETKRRPGISTLLEDENGDE